MFMHLLSKVLVVIRKKKVFWLHLPFKGVVTCRPRNSCGFGGSFSKISITLDKYLMQDSNKCHLREQAESYTLVHRSMG